MSFWAVSRLAFHRERLALHCLSLAGFETYLPRLRERRIVRGRRIESTSALFPGYLFVLVEQGWWNARWAPGTLGLVMNDASPARVPDAVIEDIRGRERGGLIELPTPPGLKRGDAVRVIHGPFKGLRGLYDGMKPRDRVVVLLRLLGGEPLVTLSKDDIEAV